MPKLHPVDELADVRAELARLRLRAAQLRAQILRQPDLAVTGRFVQARVTLHHDLVLDPALLPPEIAADPRYLRVRQRWSVQCTATAPATTIRPGWPIRRDSSAALH